MRLFVAVTPPERVLDLVAGLARPEIPGLRWTTREQWHVTLRFLGNVDDPEPVCAALRGVHLPPCDAVLGPEVARFGQRVLHVPAGGLDALAAAVTAATKDCGEPPEDRPFTGHLTLARVRRGARVDLRPLEGPAISARWPVTSFELCRSELHPHGARYTVVEAFSLGP